MSNADNLYFICEQTRTSAMVLWAPSNEQNAHTLPEPKDICNGLKLEGVVAHHTLPENCWNDNDQPSCYK